jgi:hypothetical protein
MPGERLTDGVLPRSPLPTDTMGVQAYVGTRADVTNESYYEDAFVDTTFLGRRLVGTPEERYAAVLAATLAGTRNDRETRYRLQAEIDAGDRLQRGYAGLHWRGPLAADWTGSWDPTLEFRNDRTFDRDLREWRAAFGGRVRRSLQDDLTGLEIGMRTDLLRTQGDGAAFLPDRQTAGVSAALDHFGLHGDEWRIGYRLVGRAFPDSADRDHLEHLWEGRWKSAGARGWWLAMDASGTRRLTIREVPTTRDNYWIAMGAIESRSDLTTAWGIGARVEGEATQYDVEDSTVYFDYQVARGRVELRYEPKPGWSVAIGPRAEALFARLDPGEGYQEASVQLDLEVLASGSWWNVAPSAGWRDYDESEQADPLTPAVHSSYAFYGLDLVADQSLGLGLRIRALTALRWEQHVDPAEDATSVYVTVELSRTIR